MPASRASTTDATTAIAVSRRPAPAATMNGGMAKNPIRVTSPPVPVSIANSASATSSAVPSHKRRERRRRASS